MIPWWKGNRFLVKVLRTDNVQKYISKAFNDLLRKHGIERQSCSPYTPQQNGMAEQAHRTIVEMIFFEDKMHLEDCPSGIIDKTLTVKVDISAS